MQPDLTEAATLPVDGTSGVLAGRVWRPHLSGTGAGGPSAGGPSAGGPSAGGSNGGGPSVVAIRGDGVYDITGTVATMRDLCEAAEPARIVREAKGERLGSLAAILANTPEASRDPGKPWLLAPVDLQAIKAAGVTFARSMLERVIEEQAKGSPEKAEAIRDEVQRQLGGNLRSLVPGSPQALALKQTLIAQGAWSQYLEVGIGEDAEIFTKAQPMSAVGSGMEAGLHPRSTWNNPEPEVVLAASSTGRVVAATLGNDVNLRDFEGRSALLLSKAKDNNASAAIGPFLRFFDATFSLDDVRRMDVALTVEGDDGFRLSGKSSMSEIARDPAALVAETIGKTHFYPDGIVLYLGTMFAPTEDRDAPGQGFTHKVGDRVTIASPLLGSLVNRMVHADTAPPWHFGVADLMRNLARRGVLG